MCLCQTQLRNPDPLCELTPSCLRASAGVTRHTKMEVLVSFDELWVVSGPEGVTSLQQLREPATTARQNIAVVRSDAHGDIVKVLVHHKSHLMVIPTLLMLHGEYGGASRKARFGLKALSGALGQKSPSISGES